MPAEIISSHHIVSTQGHCCLLVGKIIEWFFVILLELYQSSDMISESLIPDSVL